MTIWMIELKDRDSDNYSRFTLREEYGYFLSEEKAQAKADRLNGPGKLDPYEHFVTRDIDHAQSDDPSPEEAALDYIATRVTDDNYDNASSALEAIGEAVERTGRKIPGREYL